MDRCVNVHYDRPRYRSCTLLPTIIHRRFALVTVPNRGQLLGERYR